MRPLVLTGPSRCSISRGRNQTLFEVLTNCTIFLTILKKTFCHEHVSGTSYKTPQVKAGKWPAQSSTNDLIISLRWLEADTHLKVAGALICCPSSFETRQQFSIAQISMVTLISFGRENSNRSNPEVFVTALTLTRKLLALGGLRQICNNSLQGIISKSKSNLSWLMFSPIK